VDGYGVVPPVLEGGQRPVAGDLTLHGCHEGRAVGDRDGGLKRRHQVPHSSVERAMV
jgi:hypothetical protein